MTTSHDLVKLIRSVAEEGDRALEQDFADGVVDVVEANYASVRLGANDTATPGFYVPPGFDVQPGDHVLVFRPKGYALVLAVLNRNANASASGGVQKLRLGVIAATISADVDDWAPTGIATASVVGATVTGATRTLSGFDASNFAEGDVILLSVRTNDLVLAHASGSLSGNQIGCPNAVDLTIRKGGGVTLLYAPSMVVANPFRVISP